MKSQKPQRKKQPNILSSEQWQSESSVGFAALVGDESGSGSVSCDPPDPCTGTPPQSVARIDEKPIRVIHIPPPLPDLGATAWDNEGTFDMGAYCDGNKKVWTCRITKAECRQSQLIGIPMKELTDDAIVDADCSTLEQMGIDLDHDTKEITTAPWAPEGYIEAHEAVHARHNSESAQRRYAELLAEIEAISLPCADFKTSNEAFAAMKTTIDAAKARYFANLDVDYKNSGAHLPIDPASK